MKSLSVNLSRPRTVHAYACAAAEEGEEEKGRVEDQARDDRVTWGSPFAADEPLRPSSSRPPSTKNARKGLGASPNIGGDEGGGNGNGPPGGGGGGLAVAAATPGASTTPRDNFVAHIKEKRRSTITSPNVDGHAGRERRSTRAVRAVAVPQGASAASAASAEAVTRRLVVPKRLRAGIDSCLEEACVTFRRSIRRSVLNYALLDAGQRNRLGEVQSNATAWISTIEESSHGMGAPEFSQKKFLSSSREKFNASPEP